MPVELQIVNLRVAGSNPAVAANHGHVAQSGRAGTFRHTLVAERKLESSSIGRATAFGAVGCRFDSCLSSQNYPGECPWEYIAIERSPQGLS